MHTSLIRQLALALWLGLSLTGSVWAETINASTASELATALRQAKDGDAIVLAAGNYGKLELTPETTTARNITISSADEASAATFSAALLTHVEGMTIRNIAFDYVFAAGDADYKRVVDISRTRDITFANCSFDGDDAAGTGIAEIDGLPLGIGIYASDANRLAVSDSSFRKFGRAIVLANTQSATISGNTFSAMRHAGMLMQSMRDVVIENNRIGGFQATTPKSPDAAMISLTASKDAPQSQNIRIRNNFLDAGTGAETQSIVIGKPSADAALLEPGQRVEDVEIDGNVIRNGLLHGIAVFHGKNVVIANNTLLQVKSHKGVKAPDAPHIIFTDDTSRLKVTGNVIPRKSKRLQDRKKDWAIRNNLEIQRNRSWLRSHYAATFADALAVKAMTLEDLTVMPGSDLAGQSAGSPLLRFNDKPETPKGFIRSQATVASGMIHSFDASSIFGPGGKIPAGQIKRISWRFGDGKAASGSSVNHKYAKPGRYMVNAEVQLESGETLVLQRTIEVGY